MTTLPQAILDEIARLQAGGAPREMSNEGELFDAIEEIEACATGSLDGGRGVLPDHDYAALESAKVVMRPSVDGLMKMAIESLSETDHDAYREACKCLLMALRAAFLIGVHGTLTDGARNYFAAASGAQARTGNSARKARMTQAVRDEVEARKSECKMAASEKFARLIRPGVLNRLGISESKGSMGWPSLKTIQNCLSELKRQL